MYRILVGLDASPRAEGVLDAAAELATRTGGKLILFRAVGVPHEIPVQAYTMTPASLVELLDQDARRYLGKVSARCPPGLVVDLVVHIGVAWQGICAAADRLDADVIVIGSHGYSGIDRVIGTTAAKVVNHAKQTVLVVRSRKGRESADPSSAQA
jgi:nucleotide-binding universal stress UspA family protein